MYFLLASRPTELDQSEFDFLMAGGNLELPAPGPQVLLIRSADRIAMSRKVRLLVVW